jgi:flavin reductase (DIM6/NTAB) family NADH-FMN oxidoreductase RutF
MSPAAAVPLDSAGFRQTLGHFLTGVTVATTTGVRGEAVGMTANAFTSVSLDPPLVLLCVARTAASFEAMEQATRYAVHVLGDHQESVSAAFARSAADGAEKFSEIEWHRAEDGLPLLDDCLARIECTICERIELGDHIGYVGRVELGHSRSELAPLAFFRGRYGRLSP